jgi:hypothetical protein
MHVTETLTYQEQIKKTLMNKPIGLTRTEKRPSIMGISVNAIFEEAV